MDITNRFATRIIARIQNNAEQNCVSIFDL